MYFQEEDRKILAAMAEQQKEDDKLETARKETARADAAWMKQVRYHILEILQT